MASKGKHAVHDCTDPDHHVHDAGAYVRAVEEACADRGLRLTPLRAQVLGLIADAGKPVKAYDLLDAMKRENGSSARPITASMATMKPARAASSRGHGR